MKDDTGRNRVRTGRWRRRLKKTGLVLLAIYILVLTVAFTFHVPDQLIVMPSPGDMDAPCLRGDETACGECGWEALCAAGCGDSGGDCAGSGMAGEGVLIRSGRDAIVTCVHMRRRGGGEER